MRRSWGQTVRLERPDRFCGAVYVCDSDSKRCRVLAEALPIATSLEVREGPPRHQAGDHTAHGACCVVGLPNPFCDADLGQLGELKEFCPVIAAYAENATSLALGRRCEVFLAGAPLLLDSFSPGFERELARVVVEAVDLWTHRFHEEQRTLKVMLEFAIIGRSSLLLDVFRQAQRVSHFSDLPVLICGETGTGKELLAQAIYRQDERRCHGPFVPLNCAALNRELSDSELFGHRKGSFTGAGHDRPGLFRSAHGGVLFLDEIGELDLSLQAKLLRVLQENSILGLGDDHETRVDVRVLTATNRDLAKMVANGSFREDLYHRLNVVLLHIPPLRERTEDIAPLVTHFLQKNEHLAGTRPVTAAPSFVEALQRAFLPGNTRQLENLVRRALIKCGGGRPLEVTDLPVELWRELSAKGGANGNQIGSLKQPTPSDSPHAFVDDLLRRHNFDLESCVGECEDMLVHAVLASCHGNQAQAARLLGITPRSMYNKLRKRVASSSNGKSASA
jgi:sigma-54 specific flagellar transcriptional regulator A